MDDKLSYVKGIVRNIKSNYIRTIIGAVISFASSVVFTRSLGPNLYGVYSYIIWFLGTLAIVFSFGFEGTITKYLPQYYFNDEIDDSNKFLSMIVKKQIRNVILLSLILMVTIPFWQKLLKLNYQNINLLLVITVLNILPTVLISIFSTSILALQRFDVCARINIQTQVVTFILNVIVISISKNIEYLLLINLASLIYQFIMFYKELKRSIGINLKHIMNKSPKIKGYARIKKYANYMYINVLWQQVVWTRSEFFFLGIYSGEKEIGMYNLAYSLVGMVGLVFNPIMGVFNNYFSELVAKNEKKLLREIIYFITKYFSIILCFIFFYALIFGRPVIELVYSNKYSQVFSIFMVLLVGLFITLVFSIGGSLPFYLEKQKFVIILGILVGIVNIVLAILLIPTKGAMGAAIASTAAQVIYSLIQFVYVNHIFKLKFPGKELIVILIVNIVIYIILLLIKVNIVIKLFIGVLFAGIYFVILYKCKIINFKEINTIKNAK